MDKKQYKWTNKSEGVLCLDGEPVEIRFDRESQQYQLWVLGQQHSITSYLLDNVKHDGERIANELCEMGVKAPSPQSCIDERRNHTMTDDGRSVFPTEQGSNPDGTWNQTYDPGITLWEYFAGQALVGIESRKFTIPTDSADRAAKVADAMINEIKRRFAERADD